MKTKNELAASSGRMTRLVLIFSMRREMRQAGISFRVQDEAKKDIKQLEAALEDCASALRVIHTWATSPNGVALNDARSVVKLCRRVLDDLTNAKLIHGDPDGSNKPAAGAPLDGASC